MKLFLDDIRIPIDCVSYMHSRIGFMNPIYLEDWKIVRNYSEFIKVVEDNYKNITHISFDHDLADEHYNPAMYDDDDYRYEKLYSEFKERTGYDCAKWIKEFYIKNNISLPIIIVHSMNPVGTQNIMRVFTKSLV